MSEKFKYLKGHKLIRYWTGGTSIRYAQGRCECGKWFYDGWSDRAWSVINAHHRHVNSVRKPSTNEGHQTAPKPTD